MKHKEEIIRLRSEGKTYNQIVDILGCSKGTIAYHLGPGVKENYTERKIKYRNNISQYLREYKESRPCTDCGDSFPYYMLDFDHLGDKKFTLSRYKEYSINLDIIKEEIAKCEVVCANCHRIRTHQRRFK